MRILSTNISLKDTYIIGNIPNMEALPSELSFALSKAYEVLEVGASDNLEDYCPSDRRALQSVVDFVYSQVSGNSESIKNALVVDNLNTGKVVLFLSAVCYSR